jgi:hypothetical protein
MSNAPPAPDAREKSVAAPLSGALGSVAMARAVTTATAVSR